MAGELLNYRVMYRPLYKYKDVIFDTSARNLSGVLNQLSNRKITEDNVQYMYIHEYQKDGNPKEVVTYERPKDEQEDKVTNKPRIKLRNRPPESTSYRMSLTGKFVKEGLWTAYEVAGA